jgi:4-hydroxybenzoate polyprenyltransferase
MLAFLLFCMVSSGGYLINDVMDRKKDALHPKKKLRPIASGRVRWRRLWRWPGFCCWRASA